MNLLNGRAVTLNHVISQAQFAELTEDDLLFVYGGSQSAVASALGAFGPGASAVDTAARAVSDAASSAARAAAPAVIAGAAALLAPTTAAGRVFVAVVSTVATQIASK